ncbi:hypothetical protein ONA23_00900 [Mycoplasmopsis cynos]|uniref:hypothetical protein n=1 Tax=Mycoplasmopsis cynos TaxID=171284 RepID=UPI0024CAA01A|nr:hypothetical protein [Mycoplasmopsis cynos]MCU9933459.1 hypothetical protein [Mycoplasmopsis cynos]WAM06806.1 hypothetical protein ONA23_00900 [Mycoplasmopsis cynos]
MNKQADINSSVYSVVRARKYDKYLSESKETFLNSLIKNILIQIKFMNTVTL